MPYSYNLIYEGLANSVHEKGEHSKGTLVHDNATAVLLHANLYASNRERSALFKGGVYAAMVNNMIYNPGIKAVHYNLISHEWAAHAYETGQITLIGNVYRHGPDTKANTPLFALGGHGDVSLYMRENIAIDDAGNPAPQTGRYTASAAKMIAASEPYLPANVRVYAPESLERDLPLVVGARPWARDPIDFKLLSDVAEGRGQIIDSETENMYGYPKYPPTQRAFDAAAWNLDDMSPRAGWVSLVAPARARSARP